MCDFDHKDDCQQAAQAEREVIVDAIKQLISQYKKLHQQATNEMRAIRLMGAIMALDDTIQLIESLDA